MPTVCWDRKLRVQMLCNEIEIRKHWLNAEAIVRCGGIAVKRRKKAMSSTANRRCERDPSGLCKWKLWWFPTSVKMKKSSIKTTALLFYFLFFSLFTFSKTLFGLDRRKQLQNYGLVFVSLRNNKFYSELLLSFKELCLKRWKMRWNHLKMVTILTN